MPPDQPPAQSIGRCNCIMAAHCSPTRTGYCRLAAGGTVNAGGGVCGPKAAGHEPTNPEQIRAEAKALGFNLTEDQARWVDMLLSDAPVTFIGSRRHGRDLALKAAVAIAEARRA